MFKPTKKNPFLNLWEKNDVVLPRFLYFKMSE